MNREEYNIEVRKPNYFYFFVKRFFDIFLSFLGMVILSPIFIIISLILIVFTGFPLIYRDKRVGYKGKIFYAYKFRSMKRNANTNPEEFLTGEQLELWKKERKIDKDPRITKVGAFLRKTSLDELPQFLNIFKGDMSIVGPRPITINELEQHYYPNEREVLVSGRPGLISNWSLNGRNNITFNSGLRQKYELEYYEKRSLGFEIKLFFSIIPIVISGKGAK